jgi:hypothetical protein
MATGSVTPFRPTGTVFVAAGTTSANVQLAGGGDSVVVTNTTASLAYVRFGADPSVTAVNPLITAAATDMPVLPNTHVMLAVNSLITYAAAVLASGNGTVLLTRGDGSYL